MAYKREAIEFSQFSLEEPVLALRFGCPLSKSLGRNPAADQLVFC
jgi:hypothetical protein